MTTLQTTTDYEEKQQETDKNLSDCSLLSGTNSMKSRDTCHQCNIHVQI